MYHTQSATVTNAVAGSQAGDAVLFAHKAEYGTAIVVLALTQNKPMRTTNDRTVPTTPPMVATVMGSPR